MDNDNTRSRKRPRLMQISISDLLNHSPVDNINKAPEFLGNIKDFPLCHERLSAPLAARSQEDARSTYIQNNGREMKTFSNTPSCQGPGNQKNSADLVCFGSVG